jgi:hypothetical protein
MSAGFALAYMLIGMGVVVLIVGEIILYRVRRKA